MPLVADDRIVRTGLVAAAAAVAVSVLLGPLAEPWGTGAAGALAVVLVALGSPHGALDHLVLVTGPPARPRSALAGLGVRFVAGYAGLALLSLVAYLLAPRAGFALFLLLSVAHFAAGEVGVAVDRGLARGWTDPLAWVASLGGVVVVVLPLASREAAVAVAAVDPRLAPVLSPLDVVAPVVVAVTALALLGCVAAALRGHPHAPVVATELAALAALSLLAHPLVAFAAFFAFWHSLRHQARLAQILRGPAGAGPRREHVDRPLREVLDSARAGVPATVGVLVGAAVLAVTGTTLLGGLLAIIWALTVPHSVAVAVLEARSARARRLGTGAAPAASNSHDTTAHPAPPDVGPASPARPDPHRVRG